MAWLLGACSDRAKPHLEAAAAIQALDSPSSATLLETAECMAIDHSQAATAMNGAPAVLLTPKGRVALLTSTQAARLSVAQAQELAAVILLTSDMAAPAPTWVHNIPLIRPGRVAKPPASALQTDRVDAMRQWTASWEGWQFTQLVHAASADDMQLLATVALHPGLEPVERSIVWFPARASDEREAARLNLAITELLYSHAFSQDPAAAMRQVVAKVGQPASVTAGEALPQAGLLRRLALARQRVAAVAARTGAARPMLWQTAVLGAASSRTETNQVQAQLRDHRGALSVQRLIFTRQPHFECSGQTGADGVVGCKLKDLMGHNGHAGFERAPVIVSFPVRVDAERILPSTSMLMPR